ncbi:hypothetical protein sS8_2452 [Methylocaldum marinum]|uniref:Uncharacterized protein n=1 Tax=Methylocaldum marinum TaxID=1432792 RepID=A0A250KSA7_9GAMM|nr:hypothetical protein sS8_2452 [Methylocaldum marinum]
MQCEDGGAPVCKPYVLDALIKLIPFMHFGRLGRAFDKPVLSLSKGLSKDLIRASLGVIRSIGRSSAIFSRRHGPVERLRRKGIADLRPCTL